MGCCLSHEKQSLALTTQELLCVSKSPPRPEEESVKEVLSETPKPGFKIPKNLLPKTEEGSEEGKGPTKSNIPLTRPVIDLGLSDPTPPAPVSEEISDSVSLSESISNTTLREREEQEVLQWNNNNNGRRNRSQIQNSNNFIHNHNRARSAGRSPQKRAVESGSGLGLRMNPAQRRETGENSGRRSRSPGNRGNVGRSPSGRRNGPSPGRVRMVQGPNENVREKEKESESEWQGPNESLENPLVSLECFIFL